MARPRKYNELWAFWSNIFGPSFNTPQKVSWNKDIKAYCHRDGDHIIYKQGFIDEGWICFSDPKRKNVALFMKGFNAARKIMREFCEG